MTPVWYDKIVMFKTNTGDFVGFHTENMEIAQLSNDVWESVINFSKSKNFESMAELDAWSSSVNEKAKKQKLGMNVKTLTLNTTQLCNLGCKYCAAGGDGTYGSPIVKIDLKKGLPQLEILMNRCLPGERFQINFLGGEPLLYPEVMRSVAEEATKMALAREVSVRFAVVTNGTQFKSSRVLELLQEFRMGVTVSVDGPPEIQDRVRPLKNGGKSSVELELGLNKIYEIKNKLPSLGLAAVFDENHCNVVEAYKYFKRWDMDFYEFTFSHTCYDVKASEKFVQGIHKIAEIADVEGGEDELRKIRFFDGLFSRFDQQTKLENFCGSGKSLLSMDAKGELFACPWDINEKDLKLNDDKGLIKEKMIRFLEPQIEKSSCSTCWAKFVCGGGCSYTHNKAPLKSESLLEKSEKNKMLLNKDLNLLKSRKIKDVDPIFCLRTQNLILLAIMYYEKYRRFQ